MDIPEKFRPFLEQLKETGYVEYKGAFPWDDVRDRVERTVLAMANRRDGGVLVIGVDDNHDNSWTLTGLTLDQKDTYNLQTLESCLTSLGVPSVRCSVVALPLDSGNSVILIEVSPSIGHVTVGASGTHRNIVYVRKDHPAETKKAELSDMLAMLDDLADIKVERRLEEYRRLGFLPSSNQPSKDIESEYDEELATVSSLKTPIRLFEEAIRSRPHVRVLVRPNRERQPRFKNPRARKRLVEENRVMRRGWDFPHSSPHEKEWCFDNSFTGCQSDYLKPEIWKLYASGQYEYLENQRSLDGTSKRILFAEPGVSYLEAVSSLYALLEYVEFAKRLANVLDEEEGVSLAIEFVGFSGWKLGSSGTRNFYRSSPLEVDPLLLLHSSTLTGWSAEWREVAAQFCREFLGAFEITLRPDILRDIMNEFWALRIGGDPPLVQDH